MRKLFYAMVVFCCQTGCQSPGETAPPAQTDAMVYYDLVGFVEATKRVLQAERPIVEKTAAVNGEQRVDTLSTDSAFWARELKVFADADLNKPALRQSYRVEEQTSTGDTAWTYLAIDERLSVRQIYVAKEKGRLDSLHITVNEENAIFRSDKTMSIKMREGGLLHYAIEGRQKILVGDPFYFKVEGRIAQ